MSESSHWVDTSKSSFFQEIHHFNFLAKTVVSDLKAGAFVGRAQHVRIWSAACSTGEEAYSIAISLLEAFRDAPGLMPADYSPGAWRIEVVASDTDKEALAIATEGIYNEDSLTSLADDIKKRYFMRGRGEMIAQVRVKQGLAELIHFQHIDLEGASWGVEGPFDVIFFRGGLISTNPKTQELRLRTMLRYLNPHGYLILHHSDKVPWLKDAVLPIGQGIYQLRPRGKARYTGSERRRQSRQQETPK